MSRTMKVIHFLCLLLLSWPTMIVAYMVGAIRSGWLTGLWMHEQHEAEIVGDEPHPRNP